ncbi:MAG: hypothetical protein PHH47_09440 [Gallionella sp.]|nr:hypothetical protein [Gallionella sp.]MDD4947779.1 hypothetical protein [Gallionella sp.]
MTEAARLNTDCAAGRLDAAALQRGLIGQGDAWHELVATRCPHLFSGVAVYASPAQLQQMKDVIAAVERVVACERGKANGARGVFYGYDFHLNADGAHLIEVNTNAGGAFLNALLLASQQDTALPGEALAVAAPDEAIVAMFHNEWRLAGNDAPLNCIAIVDAQPEAQYLYPEFLLAQRLFERHGIRCVIADPAVITARDDGLYVGGQRIDLVYNRLVDFSLEQYPALLEAWQAGWVVLTPGPNHYAAYADKRKLAQFSDAAALRALGVDEVAVAALQAGVPETRKVAADDAGYWWEMRKQWFFKPDSGYGSKGSYSGAKLTRRVFEEILQGGYVAQRVAAPGTRCVSGPEGEPQQLKFDVRCYVYDGEIQLVAARLYQGQTTNFRTPGGGFAPVRVVA